MSSSSRKSSISFKLIEEKTPETDSVVYNTMLQKSSTGEIKASLLWIDLKTTKGLRVKCFKSDDKDSSDQFRINI